MVQSNQLHPGITISINKKLLRVESAIKVTVAKGNSFIKTKLRDLSTNKVTEKNFKLKVEIQDVSLKEKNIEFLYIEGKKYLFFDINDFEHVLVPLNIIGDKTNFLKEGTEVKASFYGDTVFSIDLPQYLELMVAKVEGGENEGPLTGGVKHAVLETGAKVEVPQFIEVGDIIKIDTKTSEYIQRV